MKNFILSLLQFLLFFYLLLSGPFYIFSVPFVLILSVSILLIFWALLTKKLYKSSAHTPRGVYLVTNGPYEIVRHPIYAGLLLFVLSYSLAYHIIYQFLAFLLLLIVVLVRINRDERLTEDFFKHEYIAYRKKAKRLIPYVY